MISITEGCSCFIFQKTGKLPTAITLATWWCTVGPRLATKRNGTQKTGVLMWIILLFHPPKVNFMKNIRAIESMYIFYLPYQFLRIKQMSRYTNKNMDPMGFGIIMGLTLVPCLKDS